ncbi:polygalacturonase-like [Aristolochia californica]|uniref:polygalacturonase-like n=1 Tax=Aristolochia californica TaxID=171875 RepID=UPI0035D5A974
MVFFILVPLSAQYQMKSSSMYSPLLSDWKHFTFKYVSFSTIKINSYFSAYIINKYHIVVRTSKERRNGFVQGVIFQDAIMNNVDNPIIIDKNYCPKNHGCPDQSSGVKISRVNYNDIRGTSGTEVALKLDCCGSKPCTKIGMENVKLTYQNRPVESSCRNVYGTTRDLVVPRCSET